ncbi:hypothetical protein FFLO_06584 [Filobasidium floriforme]|uniref:Uncharacterized protein n=1 Tax=Filobasidium floriforme TaxID=5210 RepID=A0A8K0NKF8_9TREE|nr:uncharacterized protein HD553DRAFT_349394 [Filobasidium floriforme]KAG7527813.1 hypothetical protein FFLO_06584 [Filobasidium floriforme]KAH8086376.1 hypothetical protein HD553DRAFT_349394 [Filobasidium floriforme]
MDADVLPLTVNFKDGSSAHFSINALAHKATTEVENMSAALELHLGALQMRVSGSPRGLQSSCSSFETVINKLRALVAEVRANQAEGLMTASVSRLDEATLSLQDVCEDLKQGQGLFDDIARAKIDLKKLLEEKSAQTEHVTKLERKIFELKKGVSDAELVKSERMQLLCLDKEFALRARYDNQQQCDRQEMKGVVASLEQRSVTAANENARLQHELQYYHALARNNKIGITDQTRTGQVGTPIR